MNAYLIDPATRTISPVETDFSLPSIYNLLGCNLISSAAGQTNGDVLFVDDNVSDGEHEAFRFGTWEIYSKALVVGTDRSGETVSPKNPIELYETQIDWLGAKMFEPNVAFLSFPESARLERDAEDRMATSLQENLDWWDAFLKRNKID
ncbi:hypothetical protein [Spirosoma endophyticum]|uniref:Uncharacterized protein n=1 Tax=Spirosoma endophyticum TaxID=662367 RepID=A0A1I2GID8_9BACT|nr:hypothetical protein [Spirosoma endophyticum]SFF16617.1 hypothetical protein SAMN05216167_13228 [Spirosoma endophyticum]